MRSPQVPQMPDTLPQISILQVIAKHFEAKYRTLEKQLIKRRISQAKQRRVDDPNVIFRDLRGEANAPIQMLINRAKSVAVSYDREFQAVELSQAQEWDIAQPPHIGDATANIVHAEADKVWVDKLPECSLPAQVSQDSTQGDLPELFQAFGQEWTKRWDRRLNLAPNHWDPVLALIDRVVLTGPLCAVRADHIRPMDPGSARSLFDQPPVRIQ